MPAAGFHPAVSAWFRERLGEPTPPQREGWPLVRAGENVLIAAPTGSGKTLAAFLSAIDSLFRQGPELPDETQVLYVSPLRALSNDVQKNLQGPLAEIRALDASLPEVRVLVRTGDTKPSDRAAMTRRPPHILVTTPESLYILLTSQGGRAMLRTVRTVIVDEIHALVRDKRGSHLALSLERLEALAGGRSSGSGSRPPRSRSRRSGAFLVGAGRSCRLVDAGSFRTLDLAVEVPPSPLATVCSHEQWEEIYGRMAELIREHRTTLVFVNTRKMAERIAAQLTKILGEEAVTSHHGSLSKERRLDAEQRLKAGSLRALVATASLELGIDIGDVDLVVQVGATRSIATFLQRVGRAGHALGRVPKGRIFPLTLDELVEAAALLRCVRTSLLDRTAQPPPAARHPGAADRRRVRRPRRGTRTSSSRRCGAPGRTATSRARSSTRSSRSTPGAAGARCSTATASAGGSWPRAAPGSRRSRRAAPSPTPPTTRSRVEPEGTVVGTVNEDFAIESNGGDIFQLGNASWRILRVEPGIVRVADAKGQPPSIPFWLGEAPGRTRELSAALADLREACADAAERAKGDAGAEPLAAAVAELRAACGEALAEPAALQLAEYVLAGRTALGACRRSGASCSSASSTRPAARSSWCTRRSAGASTAPGGSRCASASASASASSCRPRPTRRRSCCRSGRSTASRSRRCSTTCTRRAPATCWCRRCSRRRCSRRAGAGTRSARCCSTARGTASACRRALLRMRAEDLLVAAFPQVLACPETLPGGPLPVPDEHPIVRQTIEDCLTEAMDVDGFLEVLRGLARRLDRAARDRHARALGVRARHPVEPALHVPRRRAARGAPHAGRDDAARSSTRGRPTSSARSIPTPSRACARRPGRGPRAPRSCTRRSCWMGYVTAAEAEPWRAWLDELAAAGRVVRDGERWFAVEATREPKAVLRGRLEALGPVFVAAGSDDEALLLAARGRRRRAARAHRRPPGLVRPPPARAHPSLHARPPAPRDRAGDGRRVPALPRAAGSTSTPTHRLDGPRGVAEVVEQLAGFEVPAAAWEGSVLPGRVRGYRREWLDQLALSGEVVWGRFWGAGAVAGAADADRARAARRPRRVDEPRRGDRAAHAGADRRGGARGAPRARRGLRPGAGARRRLPLASVEEGLGSLVAQGRVTCDSFAGLRWLLLPASRRRGAGSSSGRWSLLGAAAAPPSAASQAEFVARRLLRRTGVVFRRTTLRERIPVPWRDVARACRLLEARGEVRGGRFVAGFDGEQYALPEAVTLLRGLRRKPARPLGGDNFALPASDPLNFNGILTPQAAPAAAVQRTHDVAAAID